MSTPSGKSTLRSSMPVSVAVMVSRVLGVIRDAVFLALFPVWMTDAFRVAFQIPNLLRDLFAEGALSSAFVPTFAATLEKEGKARAHQLANRVLAAVGIVVGLLMVLGLLFPGPVVALISGEFAGDVRKVELTVTLTRWLMPILLLISLGAVFMGMLNAEGRFVMPAFAPALFNVTSIGFGLFIWLLHTDPDRGLWWFTMGTVAAAVVQTGVQVPSLWRTGYRPALAFGIWGDPWVRRIARLMAPAVIGLAAVQVNVFVNTRFASALGDGPVTYLGNAFRLFYLPIGLFGVALATVTTTRVSQEAARGDRAALSVRTAEGLSAVWMLALPSGIGLIMLSEPVVAMLFKWGRFSHEGVMATSDVLRMYMLGVVPYSLVKSLVPGFYAIDRPRIPMVASMTAVAVNVAFNALTYRSLGAPGLALGTTLAATVNYLVLRIAFHRVIGPLPLHDAAAGGHLRRIGSLGLASAALVAVVWGGLRLGNGLVGMSRLVNAGALFATIIVAFVAYAVVLGAAGYPGARSLSSIPLKIVGRLRRR